jgi:ABC-type nitrate/sulfonate/bicarbonate transport system permease component
MRMDKMYSRSRRTFGTLVLLALMAALWQLGVTAFQVPEYLLPSPLAVAVALWQTRAAFADHTLVTLIEVLIGLAAGTALGLALAILMSWSPMLNNALYAPILATQTTPVVAIAPILIIWFGVGILPKVIIIAIFSFFPVLVNTLAGLSATSQQMVQLMNSVAATDWQIYRYIRIPMAFPHLFAGLRLAAAASVVGAIVVEWVSSTAGLGYLLILYQSRLNVSKAFATLIILMLVGVGVFAIFAWIERRFSWQKRLGIE